VIQLGSAKNSEQVGIGSNSTTWHFDNCVPSRALARPALSGFLELMGSENGRSSRTIPKSIGTWAKVRSWLSARE
jgi:hypothetical protein